MPKDLKVQEQLRWRGKPVETLTREELVEALKGAAKYIAELQKSLEMQRKLDRDFRL